MLRKKPLVWMLTHKNRVAIGLVFVIVLIVLVGVNVEGKRPVNSDLNFRQTLALDTPGAAVAVAWAPDGSELVAASDFGGVLSVWSSSGEIIKRLRRMGDGPALGGAIGFVKGTSELIFLPPVNSTKDTALSVWDVATGNIVQNIMGAETNRDYSFNRLNHFSISADQKLVVGNSSIGQNIISYSLPGWDIIQNSKFHDAIFSLSLFNKDTLIAVGTNWGRVLTLDARTGAVVTKIQVFDESKFGVLFIGAVAGSPDGSLVFAGASRASFTGPYVGSPEALAWERTLPAARILDAKSGKIIASFAEAAAPIWHAAWDPKGRYVAFLDNKNSLFIWDPVVPSTYQKISLPAQSLSFSITSDGQRIAVATNDGVKIYSAN